MFRGTLSRGSEEASIDVVDPVNDFRTALTGP